MRHPECSNGVPDQMCHPERSSRKAKSKDPIVEGSLFPGHRTFHFYVTDSVDKFKRLADRFLGRQVDNVEHVDLEENTLAGDWHNLSGQSHRIP